MWHSSGERQEPLIQAHHEGEEVRDDHQRESEDEAEDGSAPGVRVGVVVELGEHLLEAVQLGNALALEELLAVGNLQKINGELKVS